MDSFVFTRHTSDCKFKRDRLCRRCNCPKWVEGRFNHERIRKSASTRLWEEAEQFRQKLEEALARGLPLSSLHPDSPVAQAPAPALPSPSLPTAPLDTPAAGGGPFPHPASPSQPEKTAPAAETLPSTRQKSRVTIEKAVEAYMSFA